MAKDKGINRIIGVALTLLLAFVVVRAPGGPQGPTRSRVQQANHYVGRVTVQSPVIAGQTADVQLVLEKGYRDLGPIKARVYVGIPSLAAFGEEFVTFKKTEFRSGIHKIRTRRFTTGPDRRVIIEATTTTGLMFRPATLLILADRNTFPIGSVSISSPKYLPATGNENGYVSFGSSSEQMQMKSNNPTVADTTAIVSPGPNPISFPITIKKAGFADIYGTCIAHSGRHVLPATELEVRD